MKHLITLFLSFFFALNTYCQVVEIPDENFKQFLTDLGVDSNQDGEIQVSEAILVETMYIEGNDYEISSIEGIKSFENLASLKIHNCPLMMIDVSGMVRLETLDIDDVFEPKTILAVGCTSLNNVSDNSYENQLIDLSGCSALISFENDMCGAVMNFTNCSALKRVELNGPCFTHEVTLAGCTSLSFLNFDNSYSGQSIDFTGLTALDSIILFGFGGAQVDVEVEGLPNLSYLYIEEAHNIVVRDCPNIEEVITFSGLGETLFLENLPKLNNFNIEAPFFETLTIDNCPTLTELDLGSSDITNLIVKNCMAITEIEFMNVIMPELCDFTGLSSLKEITFSTGPRVLILDGCYNLEKLDVQDMSAAEVYDFSNLVNLNEVNLGSCYELKTLILQNGSNETVTLSDPFSLENVCVDPDEFLEIQTYLTTFENVDVEVTISCEFANGGSPFGISGISYLDINNDSCLTSNVQIPFTKYKITESNGGEGFFYGDPNGRYDLNVIEGQYTYGPDLEFGDYVFTTFPENVSVDFPTDGSLINQDFCFIPSVEEVDIIEVNLIPLEVARPGFDASYLITYKNTGNVTRGGDIKLTFQDEFMDFLFSEPMVSVQEEGFLSWSFEDLAPFETGRIEFSMNLNSPMDTPPLNGDDVINFKAEVGPLGNQTLTVYWSYLEQEIVNSFDPNDKTCLNGNAFDQELVGDYLKYMIRFENTGSAEAVNIVVSDTLDDTKFDVRTLQVINSSHEVETELEGNVVKFYFRDIYLPFDDATNDGYVTFKLKTLPTLTLGEDIRNKAEIFFDFNFPIITNTTSTVVSDFTSVVDNQENDFEFEVFPNPTLGNVLLKGDTDMTKIDIMDVSGKLLKSIAFTTKKKSYSISLDDCAKGVYFIKAYSKNDISTKKVVKN